MPLALTANVVTHSVSWWNKLPLHTDLNRQQVATHFQLLNSDYTIIYMGYLSAQSPLSKIRSTVHVSFQTVSCNQLSVSFITQTRGIHASMVLTHLISVCVSAVLGVWYPAYPGWETQEVWSLSRGVRVCCSQPLFGHCLPVPLPPAAHRPLPLKLNLHEWPPLRNSFDIHLILKRIMYLDSYGMKIHAVSYKNSLLCLYIDIEVCDVS